MSRLNPAVAMRGGQPASVRLEPGQVIYVARLDTADLAAVAVDRLEVADDGALLLVLRRATHDEFAARAAESAGRRR